MSFLEVRGCWVIKSTPSKMLNIHINMHHVILVSCLLCPLAADGSVRGTKLLHSKFFPSRVHFTNYLLTDSFCNWPSSAHLYREDCEANSGFNTLQSSSLLDGWFDKGSLETVAREPGIHKNEVSSGWAWNWEAMSSSPSLHRAG